MAVILQMLSRGGDFVDQQNFRGETPLHCACINTFAGSNALEGLPCSCEVLSFRRFVFMFLLVVVLRSHSSLEISDQETSSHLSPSNPRNSVSYFIFKSLLVDMHADPNLADLRGMTALHFAVASGNVEISRVLLERGADPKLTNFNGKTCRQLASELRYIPLYSPLLSLLSSPLSPLSYQHY